MATIPASGGLSSSGIGLRFLSFDGGGIHAISQALMVREIMGHIGAARQLSSPVRVCDYFDMICGSGLGGLLAIMCGVLKMTGDELVSEFVDLCKAVFSEGLDITQRTTILEGQIKRLIRTYSGRGEERKMVSPDDICKVFVCAAPLQNTSHPHVFRNYDSTTDTNVDCMLWEATRATTASLGLFNPLIISEISVDETIIEDGLRWNNPTEQLLKEAAHIFEGCAITSVVNIGSGHSGELTFSEKPTVLFPRIALDCERVAENVERRFGSAPEAFWRLAAGHDVAVDLSNLDAIVSHTRSYLRGALTTCSIDAIVQDLIQRPERIPVDRVSGLAGVELELHSRKLCPLPAQYFTGRRSELQKLDNFFTSDSAQCRIAVLYGTDGSGKTQTGLEFIQQSQGRFTDVFYIDASDKLTLENDLKAIASEALDSPTIDDALNFLRTKKTEWLLFLNNADDPSLDLRPYIVWPHGNILITTRNSEMRVHAPDRNIFVDKLELDDAKELLLRGVTVEKSSETDTIVSEIVQELGCFALAVSQARGFLAQDICTLSEYLPIYIENRRKLLEDGLIQTTDGYEHIVYITWTINLSKLSSSAAFFIELLCFMHRDAIPSRIFEDAWKELKPLEEEAVPATLVAFLSSFEAIDLTWDVLRFRRLIMEVLSFSLMEFNAKNRTFSLHPLVQGWAQSRCNNPQEMIHSTQTLLSLATPASKSQKDDAVAMSLLPHLRASAQTGLMVHYTLLHRPGHIYSIGGMFRECREVHEQEVSEMQKRLGPEHPDIIISMINLATANSALGQHKDALNLADQALALSIQIQGEEHVVTLMCMENLTSIYLGLGQHSDALTLQEKVLARRVQILGEGHPMTLASMGILASVNSTLGQHTDALKLEEKILALSTQILGEEHRDTLASMNNLALIYSALGRLKDALKLQEKLFALSTQFLGEEHPETLTCMNNISVTYSGLGQYKDALKLQEQILELRIQILGEDHLNTLDSMHNLACTYSDLGQHRDALKIQEKILALRVQIQGEEHPDTLTCMNNLASIYLDLGRYVDALELQDKVLALSTQILGEEHPDTLKSMNDLALVYSALGRYRDAQKHQEKVLAPSTQVIGEECPETLTCMDHLALTHSYLGQQKNALKLQEQALGLRTRTMGEEHPDTLTSMSNLARTYSDLRQFRDALKLQEKALALRTQVLGEEHPSTLTSMNNLAITHLRLGRLGDALTLQEKVLAVSVQVLGKDHPDTLKSMHNLACIYENLGQLQDALELHEQTLENCRRVLGSEHPVTIGSAKCVKNLYNRMASERASESESTLDKLKRLLNFF